MIDLPSICIAISSKFILKWHLLLNLCNQTRDTFQSSPQLQQRMERARREKRGVEGVGEALINEGKCIVPVFMS